MMFYGFPEQTIQRKSGYAMNGGLLIAETMAERRRTMWSCVVCAVCIDREMIGKVSRMPFKKLLIAPAMCVSKSILLRLYLLLFPLSAPNPCDTGKERHESTSAHHIPLTISFPNEHWLHRLQIMECSLFVPTTISGHVCRCRGRLSYYYSCTKIEWNWVSSILYAPTRQRSTRALNAMERTQHFKIHVGESELAKRRRNNFWFTKFGKFYQCCAMYAFTYFIHRRAQPNAKFIPNAEKLWIRTQNPEVPNYYHFLKYVNLITSFITKSICCLLVRARESNVAVCAGSSRSTYRRRRGKKRNTRRER